MGGGPVRLTNLLVWGVDLVEEHLLTTAGIPSRPPVRSWQQRSRSKRSAPFGLFRQNSDATPADKFVAHAKSCIVRMLA